MVAAASDPTPAVIAPGVIVKPLTGRVRAFNSSLPAALVGVVALTERAHAAPVPCPKGTMAKNRRCSGLSRVARVAGF